MMKKEGKLLPQVVKARVPHRTKEKKKETFPWGNEFKQTWKCRVTEKRGKRRGDREREREREMSLKQKRARRKKRKKERDRRDKKKKQQTTKDTLGREKRRPKVGRTLSSVAGGSPFVDGQVRPMETSTWAVLLGCPTV